MKKYKTIFFDLDGTLVLENFNLFIKLYIENIAKFLKEKGYNNPEPLAKTILKGENFMVTNDGLKLNNVVFWDYMKNQVELNLEKLEKDLEEFYKIHLYEDLKPCAIKNNDMVEIVKYLKSKNYNLVLTTNSVFPQIANEERLKWNNLDISYFTYVTNYDNSHYAKPNYKYYEEVLKKLNLKSDEVLMIGNDGLTDGAALKCGIDFYLVTDTVLNENETNPTYKGKIKDLKEFIIKNF